MPWSTPSLRAVRQLVRDSVRANLPGADALVPNSVLRVISDNQGALAHLVLQYIDWLALQLLPDTAEYEWLDRHGNIWLTNADGTTGRKLATPASGVVTVTGTQDAVVPAGTLMSSALMGSGVAFETTERVYVGPVEVPTPVRVRALDVGTASNVPVGSMLSVATTPGVDAPATVISMYGGTNTETDDQLRIRILRRIRQPPMGGASYDYENWALAVPGVTRAWAYPNEMGIGTLSLRFLMDDLRAADDGWPTPDDIRTVAAYIDKMRPVTVKDCYVLAPIKQFINLTVANLVPDTVSARNEIERSVRRMLFERAQPGQTIFAAWKNYAVMNAASVESFTMINNNDDVMLSPGHMAVLGTIHFVA